MKLYDILGLIFLGIPLIIGVIGVIIERIRKGKRWIGQGFGEK